MSLGRHSYPVKPPVAPGKYSLPAIRSSSPASGAVVPYVGDSGRRSDLRMYSDNDEKVRVIESRMAISEKSNRALLEEVMRLQNDLRMTVRRNEDQLRDERQSRQQLESAIKVCNDIILQLSMRIKTAEEKIGEERQQLASLLDHTKAVEQTVVTGHQELRSKKDAHSAKLQELQANLAETLRVRENQERLVQDLQSELRNLRSKVDIQGTEFATLATDLKMKAKRLEDDNRLQGASRILETLRKQGDLHSQTEHSTTFLRSQVESRLSELRDVIMELRGNVDQEANDRRALEQKLQLKVNELQQAVGEQNRKREESLHALDKFQREKEHVSDTERIKLQSRVSETFEELNRKILTKEIKLREEIQEKYLQLEKVIQQEQQARYDYEKNVREANEQRWHNLKKMSDEEVGSLRESVKSDRQKQKESIQKLDEAVSLLERQLQENRKQIDKVLTAEIKSRKVHEKDTEEKLQSLQEKLQLATATLQQAIGGINQSLNTQSDKVRRETKAMLAEQQQSTTRLMTDLDAQLQSLKERLGSADKQVETRLAESAAVLQQNLREKVDSISTWQEVTNSALREMTVSLQQVNNDVYANEEKHTLLKAELDSRVTAEADSRMREIDGLRQEINNRPKPRSDPNMVTRQEMQDAQASMRKLAESIQTVKTVLGMKIQSEQKLRIDEVKGLQEEMAKLRAMLEDRRRDPRLFVKDPNEPSASKAEANAPEANKWGVGNAHRWMMWKEQLLKLHERAKSKPSSDQNDEKDDNKDDEDKEKDDDNKSDDGKDKDDEGKDDAKDDDEKDDKKDDDKDDKKDDDKDDDKKDDDKDDDKKDDDKKDDDNGDKDKNK